MPQMSPMNWMYLMFFFLLIYLLSLMQAYYYNTNKLKSITMYNMHWYKMKWY